MNIIKFIKKHSVFAIIFSLLVGASSCLNFEEEEEEKPLLSAIDGEEYYQTLQGEMSVEKAFILIDKDSVELVPTVILFEMMENLISEDSLIRVKNFEYLNKINYYMSKSLTDENFQLFQTFIFSKLLKFPVETIQQIHLLSEFDYDFWTMHLKLGYQFQLMQEGITKISVTNVMLKNCLSCSEQKQEDIVSFVDYLELN
jgi:hypothetical protein